jgi:RNA-binding protein 8A
VNSKSSTHQNHRHRHHHHPQQQHHPSDLPIIQQVVEESKSTLGPIRSVEGWILFVTGVHEEVQEDDIRDAFSEYGTVENISIQQDKRTGFCKGYALIEYREHSEAQDAINALHGTSLLGKTIHVDWAFVGGSASTTPVPTNDLNSGGGKSSSRNHYDRRRNR